MPTEEAADIVRRLNLAKQNLMEHMTAFNKLLSIGTLNENRSIKDKESEQQTINKLVRAALEVEQFSAGEGLLGMCVLNIRQCLSLRDAGNELAYKVNQLQKEINKLKDPNFVDDEKEKAKAELLELAKKSGLELSFKVSK
jgi:hypothetical protein